MSSRTPVVLAAALVLAGCAPAIRQAPARTGDETSKPAAERDCSRQFDENDAGFQTCTETP